VRTLDGMFHRRASGALAVVLCAGCLAPASAVAALEPGVHVDPNSPAAKEYGVPLWVLRGDGAGQQSPEGIPPPPLFGVGIGPPASGRGGGTSRAGGGSASGSGGSGSRPRSGAGSAARRGSSGGASATLTPAAIAQLTHEGSAAPHVGLVVGGVLLAGLLLGGAVALGARRLRR
jgi:hypothetical protein